MSPIAKIGIHAYWMHLNYTISCLFQYKIEQNNLIIGIQYLLTEIMSNVKFNCGGTEIIYEI